MHVEITPMDWGTAALFLACGFAVAIAGFLQWRKGQNHKDMGS